MGNTTEGIILIVFISLLGIIIACLGGFILKKCYHRWNQLYSDNENEESHDRNPVCDFGLTSSSVIINEELHDEFRWAPPVECINIIDSGGSSVKDRKKCETIKDALRYNKTSSVVLICVVIDIFICVVFALGYYKPLQSNKYSEWELVLSSKIVIEDDEFNKMFWLTVPTDNEENKRYNDYGIFLYICPYCRPQYRRIYYKRLTFAPEINLLDIIKSNWTAHAEYNNIGIDYNLYSSFKDLKENANPWASCLNNVNNVSIGFPGLCVKDGNIKSFKSNQAIIYDNENEKLNKKSIKVWVLNRKAFPSMKVDDQYNPDYVTKSPTMNPVKSSKYPSRTPTKKPKPEAIIPGSPTASPIIVPTASPVVNEEYFPGWSAFRRGWNYVKNEKSGSLILAQNKENYNGFDDTSDDCSYGDLSFKSSVDGFDRYAKTETQTIESSYGKDKLKVAGKASRTRNDMKIISTSKQYYYYIMNVQCIRADVSLPTFDKVHWDLGFLTELSILPYPFNPNDFSIYQLFFDKYGTHIVQHAQLGGKVEGAISIPKCEMHEAYSKSSEFEACLNVDYTGKAFVCNANGNSEASSYTAANYVGKSSLRVIGGKQADFGLFINDFTHGSQRGQEFADWIATLQTNPAIIGGNLYRFDDAIKNALTIGNHNFNEYGHFPDSSTLVGISNALTSAYDYYYNLLIDTSPQCQLNCNNGNQNGCQCTNCGDTFCCPNMESNIDKIYIHIGYIVSIISLILI